MYPNNTLAEMYNRDKMGFFTELRKAHVNNDRAVMRAYGFSIKDMSEAECVAELMKMYQKLIDEQEA